VGSHLFNKAIIPDNPYHDWFYFGDEYPTGVRLWADVQSLPELNLENDQVKDYIYRKEDSVIRTYLKAGVDGWRLDVAFDLGYQVLRELTDYAHQEKEGSLIVGETWNYPKKWLEVMDGVMNFTLREIIFHAVKGEFSPKRTNELLKHMITDSGIDGLLKSWNILDNHDTDRLNHRLTTIQDQKLAQVLQFTFPGSPNLYYGVELGMKGGNEPENRAPMRWDLNTDENKVLKWTKSLIDLHQTERAIKIGDYLAIEAEKLIAYERFTDLVEDTTLIFMNPTSEEVDEFVLIPDSSLMNYSKFEVILGEAVKVEMIAGFLKIKLSKKSFAILKPVIKPALSYTPYKRV
jgi:glycosidase